MLSLHSHPFPVEAFFRWSLVVTYALPAEVLAPLVGPGLALDTFEDFGFLAIALVQTEGLRPRGLPRWMGRDFFLSGYRIFTRFARPGQQSLRGLKILRSDTDRRSMATLGNLFTRYNYCHAKVDVDAPPGGALRVKIATPGHDADLDVEADLSEASALPAESPFHTMDEARSFAGPLPYTFHYDEAAKAMVVVRGLRKAWDPAPVAVTVRQASFLDQPALRAAGGKGARLANAFYLERVPYSWKAGTVEAVA
jgi:hypothetical protein